MNNFDLRKYLKHNPLLERQETNEDYAHDEITDEEVDRIYVEFPEIDDPNYEKKEVIGRQGELVLFRITLPNGLVYHVQSDPFGHDRWFPIEMGDETKTTVSELKTRIKEIIKSKVNEVKKDEHGNHLEPQFKKGDKVTYLGNPGEITKVNKTASGTYTYSVSYDKGTGKTKASDLSNKGSELKKA